MPINSSSCKRSQISWYQIGWTLMESQQIKLEEYYPWRHRIDPQFDGKEWASERSNYLFGWFQELAWLYSRWLRRHEKIEHTAFLLVSANYAIILSWKYWEAQNVGSKSKCLRSIGRRRILWHVKQVEGQIKKVLNIAQIKGEKPESSSADYSIEDKGCRQCEVDLTKIGKRQQNL